ncbi:MAG: FG-GAP-like repeat-containing protein [Anaeromyxobacteraceae bacterium]
MAYRRSLQWVLAALVVMAVASCKSGGATGGGGPGPGGNCPSGQTLQGGKCVSAVACTAGGSCNGSQICVGGFCAEADATCTWHPPKGAFAPRVAWEWTDSTTLPQYADVLMTPVVVPLERSVPDAFQAPAVVFNTIPFGQGAGSELPGVMRAVSGRDGTELWTSDPAHLVNGLAGIAAGDLDGDGFTEFVTARNGTTWPATDPGHKGPPTDDGLVAFDHDGKFLWDLPGIRVFWGAPSIANLYGRKDAQVIIGATVVDATGHVVCQGSNGNDFTKGIGENFLGPISTVADVDLDGSPDIVTGNVVYDNQCRPKPGWPNGQPDGLVAVANFTGDAHPEIVVVSAGTVRMQDWQGKVIWGPVAIPGGGNGGGAPTVADFDGDGQLEIGVAGQSTYTVFKPFAANPVLWSNPTQDTSMVTGSSVFDFEHDGKAEVVYGDECYTRVYDGTTGKTLFEAPRPSCTVHENPVIADVDQDGRAEIVVATNSVCNIVCPWGPHNPTDGKERRHGITVYNYLRDRWVSTRPIWNQHAYHVTNVNDDGSIPSPEANQWQQPGLNAFRMNVIGDEDFRAPDLVSQVQDVGFDATACPQHLRLTVKVWNRGAVLVAAGVPIAVYQGRAGGKLLAVGLTLHAIVPGASETVTIDIASPPLVPTDVTTVVNDDGTGEGVVGECNTTNDAVQIPSIYCPPASG